MKMKQHKTVLILTDSSDPHVPPVIEGIQQRGVQVCRFNLADFPSALQLSAQRSAACTSWTGVLTYQTQRISLDDCRSVWWRRPTPYKAPESATPGERVFYEREARQALIGVLEAKAFWVSPPDAIRQAELKMLQLERAQQLGLAVPRSLVTNTPEDVHHFFRLCHGNIVIKAVGRATIKDDEKNHRILYTRRVRLEDLSNAQVMEGVRVTAHLFQERVPKAFDLRVVVIGKQMFAAEMHDPEAVENTDFRLAYDRLIYKEHHLPDDLKHRLFALVRSFHLQFSSMDLIVTPNGEYKWLELNPAGQFLWLQERIGAHFSLTEAMTNLLVEPEAYCL
jgi:hypothetical protein